MKAYEIQKGSTSLTGLHRAERPDPQKPGAGQVLIRVRATSLNYRDHAVMFGQYYVAVDHDTIPLSDGAGEVVEVGEGVTRVKAGDHVAGTFFQVWKDGPRSAQPPALGVPLDGMLAEYVVLHEDGVVKLPESLSFEEGASLPCAGVTAWNALMVAGKQVKPGDTVLCQGTGGVAMFALQIARAAGARVIVTSSSDAKLDKARSLGASDGINYKASPDWEKEVLRLTDGRGVDLIVDICGTAGLARSFQALGFGGKIALIGFLAGPGGDSAPYPLMMKGGSMEGVGVGSTRMFEDLLRAIDVNGIKPVIDKVYPFDEAPDAFRHLASREFMGKIVISV